MTPQEAEIQARELADNCAVAIFRSNPMTKSRRELVEIIIKELDLTNLIIKAGERDDEIKSRNGHTFESLQKMWEDAHIEIAQLNSIVSSLKEQVAIEKRHWVEDDRDLNELIQERDSLREKLELAQADCAVKYEALKRVVNFICPACNKMMHDGSHLAGCYINAALSTNPGQSLLDELKHLRQQQADCSLCHMDKGEVQVLIEQAQDELAFYKRTTALTGQARKLEQDELKLAKQKAAALDWIERNEVELRWHPDEVEPVTLIIDPEGGNPTVYRGLTLIQTATQAMKEEKK